VASAFVLRRARRRESASALASRGAAALPHQLVLAKVQDSGRKDAFLQNPSTCEQGVELGSRSRRRNHIRPVHAIVLHEPKVQISSKGYFHHVAVVRTDGNCPDVILLVNGEKEAPGTVDGTCGDKGKKRVFVDFSHPAGLVLPIRELVLYNAEGVNPDEVNV
jgi:hypothetical protein